MSLHAFGGSVDEIDHAMPRHSESKRDCMTTWYLARQFVVQSQRNLFQRLFLVPFPHRRSIHQRRSNRTHLCPWQEGMSVAFYSDAFQGMFLSTSSSSCWQPLQPVATALRTRGTTSRYEGIVPERMVTGQCENGTRSEKIRVTVTFKFWYTLQSQQVKSRQFTGNRSQWSRQKSPNKSMCLCQMSRKFNQIHQHWDFKTLYTFCVLTIETN